MDFLCQLFESSVEVPNLPLDLVSQNVSVQQFRMCVFWGHPEVVFRMLGFTVGIARQRSVFGSAREDEEFVVTQVGCLLCLCFQSVYRFHSNPNLRRPDEHHLKMIF